MVAVAAEDDDVIKLGECLSLFVDSKERINCNTYIQVSDLITTIDRPNEETR